MSYPDPHGGGDLPNNPGKGSSQIFYKTRMCRNFLAGKCRNGELCNYAHASKELGEAPPNWQGLVRGSWDDYHKAMEKMKICTKFYIGEECPYGERCGYRHEHPPEFKSDDMMRDQRESEHPPEFKSDMIRVQRVSERRFMGTNVSIPGKSEQEDTQFHLWKSTKKMSGIYADWIDEQNPPHLPPTKDDDV